VQINLWPDELHRPKKQPIATLPASTNQPNKAVREDSALKVKSHHPASIIGKNVHERPVPHTGTMRWRKGTGVGADIHQTKTKVFSARLNTNLMLKVGDSRLTPAPSNIRPIAERMNGTKKWKQSMSTETTGFSLLGVN
jgi:hypothetical protein